MKKNSFLEAIIANFIQKKERKLMEAILRKRLKFIGYILCFFGVAFSFSHFFPPTPNFEEITPHKTFNFFLVGLLFIFLGICCHIPAFLKKKKKR